MSEETRTVSATGGAKGVKLERFDLIPIGPLTELAEHFGRGARKYQDHQWRKGYEWSKTYAALMRHLTAFWAGEDYDVCPADGVGCSLTTATGEDYVPFEERTCYNHTGSHHMAAVAWHAFVMLEFKDRFPEHDDRYLTQPEPEPERHEYPSWWSRDGIMPCRLRDAVLEQFDRTPFTDFVVTITGDVEDVRQHSRDFLGYGPDLLRKRRPFRP